MTRVETNSDISTMAGYKTFEQFREAIKPIRGPEGRGWSDADVVIVGAGPIGLTAANLLGSLGVTTLLIERNEFTSDLPRALVVDDEYMRLLDNLGILPELRDDIAAPFGIFSIHRGESRSSRCGRS